MFKHRQRNLLSNSDTLKQGFHGLAVFDPVENKMIYEYNSEKYFTPASNIKLFTLYTGLKILGDSVPALHYFVRNDSLFFWGTGDPSLLNPDLPQSQVLEFLKERDEQLFYLPPPQEEKYFGPGWAWDDFNSSYSVERGSFPLYGNRVNFRRVTGNTKLLVTPRIFSDSVSVVYGNTFRGIRRDMTTNNFNFVPESNTGNLNQSVPFKYSSNLVANILGDTLQKEITIMKNVDRHAVYKTVHSLPVDSIYKRMMEVSDNFIAEQILLLASQKLTDTLSSNIAIEYMLKNYLNDLPDEPKWVDGSGLSRYNLVTPRTMIALLTKIKNEIPQERLFNMLATGGVSGTIRNNYVAGEPYIFAKTGTLRHNHSLSGYLKAKSGKILLFSFMNSNYTVPTNDVKAQMEIILREFYINN
jgi:serine-type D-Ala-D-Ala carboxypeptidase/endopeptidase (penicillin-binding protein 4)